MDEDEEELVPLPNVNAAILKKVIQWATYHKDDPPPPEDDENKEKRTDDISSWDADFLKVSPPNDPACLVSCYTMMILEIILALLHLRLEHCRMHVMRVEGFF